ncbi:hypothetical protein [Actinomadura madurae]|uniref:hypothetical protein n=1 Tax=Actinomadura madurae TaxID=1993 RepID=UPI0020D20252|nr:hypothetical protein [Actinomadura madurae]MCQ0005354.1 hypothetical protein [Actinomadura madurae]
MTARIGDGGDTLRHGTVSSVNAPARALGCEVGMPCQEAVRTLAGSVAAPAPPAPAEEARHLLRDGRPRVWALDSASLAGPDDEGDVLVTGSHGGLLGGTPGTALRAAAAAAVFNDAGVGRDAAGLGRLPPWTRGASRRPRCPPRPPGWVTGAPPTTTACCRRGTRPPRASAPVRACRRPNSSASCWPHWKTTTLD